MYNKIENFIKTIQSKLFLPSLLLTGTIISLIIIKDINTTLNISLTKKKSNQSSKNLEEVNIKKINQLIMQNKLSNKKAFFYETVP